MIDALETAVESEAKPADLTSVSEVASLILRLENDFRSAENRANTINGQLAVLRELLRQLQQGEANNGSIDNGRD